MEGKVEGGEGGRKGEGEREGGAKVKAEKEERGHRGVKVERERGTREGIMIHGLLCP